MKLWQSSRRFLKLQWRKTQKISKSVSRTLAPLWKRLTSFKTTEVKDTGTHFQVKKASPQSFLNPLFWVQQSFQFAVRYGKSRSLTALLQGLPVLASILAAILLYFWTRPNQDLIIDRLKTQRNLAVAQDDFETADFYARKLCLVQANSENSIFERAKLYDHFDRGDQARILAFQLAQNKNHLPALEWLCEMNLERLQKAGENFPAEDHRTLIDNTLELINRAESNPKAHVILGTAYLLIDDFARARIPIERAIELLPSTPPELFWSMSAISGGEGHADEAREFADQAASGFVKRYAMQLSTESRESVVRMIKALVQAEREKEAVKILEARIESEREQSSGANESLLAEVYASWARRMRISPNVTLDSLARGLKHLKSGLTVSPGHPALLDELTELSCSEAGKDLLTQEKLMNLLDSGVSPGLIHFILGTRIADSEGGDNAKALRHLELAAAHSSAFPGLLNNLADLILQSENGDPKRALTLVELALRAIPNHPYFLDTRGKAHLQLKNFDAAIADFERALAAPELEVRLHQQLADAYEGAGDKSQAQRHGELANALRSK